MSDLSFVGLDGVRHSVSGDSKATMRLQELLARREILEKIFSAIHASIQGVEPRSYGQFYKEVTR